MKAKKNSLGLLLGLLEKSSPTMTLSHDQKEEEEQEFFKC